MEDFVRRNVQSENELVFLIKEGHSLLGGGVHYTLWNQRAIKGEILNNPSPSDFSRANEVTSKSESMIAKLVKMHLLFGISDVTFIVLYNRGGRQVLVRWSVV